MVDFTRYEYQDLVDRMTDKLRNAQGWGDGYDSSMGQVLIQLVADTTDHLHYMLERRTTESYLYTARTRSAVIAKASERGYHYRRSLGNRGTLTLTTSTLAQANIIIPQFSEFSFDGLTYISTEQVFIPTGQNSIEIPVVQGAIVNIIIAQEYLDSSGNYIIESNYDQIDDLAISLNSDGFALAPVWKTTKRAMSFLSPTDNFYDVRYGFDGMRFIFGDGEFGRKPLGDIGLKYVQINPDEQPLNTLANDFTFEFTLSDVNGVEYTGTAINTTRIFNGSGPEDIDSIRTNATIEHNSAGRAVTNEDSIYWILNSGIGAIVDVNVTGESETNTYAYNTNNIYVNYANAANSELTPTQKTELRNYLATLSIANPHYVLNKANELLLAVGLSVKKDRLLDISTADYYQILKQFLENYFSIKRGAIGARYEHSDLIRDLYQLEIERNNIRYKLVDFLRLDIDLLLPITIPLQNTEVLVKLAGDTPKNNGSNFAILLNGIFYSVPVTDSDSNLDLLYRMRDYVFANSSYLAEVLIGDTTGTYQETYNNTVGGGLIVGVNVPMNNNNKMMGNFVIGSNIGTVLIDSPAYNLQHEYLVGYENSIGRRPIIPLAVGTTVSFTAPLDTDIRVFVRTNLNDSSTETLYFTVSNGATFTDTFDNYHSIQLEYVQTSNNNMTVTFNYPLVDSAANTGLRIYTRDGYGTFTASKDAGDISSYVSILKNRKVPVISSGEFTIQPESMTIVDSNNNTLYRSTRAGTLISAVNLPSLDGRVNYRSGVVTVPSELINGEYFIKFKQDKYQNVHLAEDTIARMTTISETINTPNPFSFIEVV